MAKRVIMPKGRSALSAALDHVVICSQGVANYAPYCSFQPGWLVGYDGVVAAGHRVSEQLQVAPHTETFRYAVARAGEPYSLTVMADGRVIVRGQQFRTEVPSFPPDALHNAVPDPPLLPVSEQLRVAIVNVSKITTNKTDRVVGASVKLRNQCATATDGVTILDDFHGQLLDGDWLLPREFAEAIGKCKLLPTHIGYSEQTFTMWFGENAWLRTNLYHEKFPDTDLYFTTMLSEGDEMRPVPTELLYAVETLKPFLLSERLVVLTDDTLYCVNSDGSEYGASFHIDHHILVHPLRPVPYDGLKMAATHGQWITFTCQGIFWYGETMRGITAAKVL